MVMEDSCGEPSWYFFQYSLPDEVGIYYKFICNQQMGQDYIQ